MEAYNDSILNCYFTSLFSIRYIHVCKAKKKTQKIQIHCQKLNSKLRYTMSKIANQVSTSNPQIKHAVNAVSHILFSLQRVDSKALAWPTSERSNQSIHNKYDSMLPPLIPFTKPVCNIPRKKKRTSKNNENNVINKTKFFTFLKNEESIADTIRKNENRNSNSTIVSELLKTYQPNQPSEVNFNTSKVSIKYPTTTNSRTSKVLSTMQLNEHRSPYDMALVQTKNNTKLPDYKHHDLSSKTQSELLKHDKQKSYEHFINTKNNTTSNRKMIFIKKIYKVPSRAKNPKTETEPRSMHSTEVRNTILNMPNQKLVRKKVPNCDESSPMMKKKQPRGVKKKGIKVNDNLLKIKPPEPKEHSTNDLIIERVYTVPSYLKLKPEIQPRVSIADVESVIFKMLGEISKKPQKIIIHESKPDMMKKQLVGVQKNNTNIQGQNMQIILQEKMMLPIREFTKKPRYKNLTDKKSTVPIDNKQQTNKKQRKFGSKNKKRKHDIDKRIKKELHLSNKVSKLHSDRNKKDYWTKEIIDGETKSLGEAAVQTNSSFLLETFLDTLISGSNKLLENLNVNHPKARDFEVMAARGRLVRKARTLQFGNTQANIDFDDLASDFKEYHKSFPKDSSSKISQSNALSLKPIKNKVGNDKLKVNEPRKWNGTEIRTIRLCNTETQTYESLFKIPNEDSTSKESSKSLLSTDSQFPYKIKIPEQKISTELSEFRDVRYRKLWTAAVTKLKQNDPRLFYKTVMPASSSEFKKLFPGVNSSLRNIFKSALGGSFGSHGSYVSRVRMVRQYIFDDNLSLTDLDNISVSDIDVNEMLNYPYKTIFPDVEQTSKPVKLKSKIRKKKKASKKNTRIKSIESVENPCCCICRKFHENRSKTEEPWIRRMKLDWNRIELKAYMIQRQNIHPSQLDNPKPNCVNIPCVNPRTICDQMYEFCKNLDWQHCSSNIFTEL